MQINKTISLIIFFQILILLVLAINIYYKKNQKVSVSPINKNDIKTETLTESLKYYYELEPNRISSDSAYFLKKPFTNKFNDDGLNDLTNYSVEKPEKTFRIIALGDSFTYGDHVKTQDNWTELLENKLNSAERCKKIDKFEVINFGVCGYDIQYEVENYKNKGQKYNPDLIIWMLVDPNRMNEIEREYTKKCYDSLTPNKDNLEEVMECAKNASEKYTKPPTEEIVSIQRKRIEDFNNRYIRKIFFIDFFDKHREITNNIPNSTMFNDMLTEKYILKNNKTNEIFFPDGHPNELGHQLIADIIYDKLFELNQIPCK